MKKLLSLVLVMSACQFASAGKLYIKGATVHVDDTTRVNGGVWTSIISGSTYEAKASTSLSYTKPTNVQQTGGSQSADGNQVIRYVIYWVESTVGEGTPSHIYLKDLKIGNVKSNTSLSWSGNFSTLTSTGEGNVNWGFWDNLNVSSNSNPGKTTDSDSDSDTRGPNVTQLNGLSWTLAKTYGDGRKAYVTNLDLTMASCNASSSIYLSGYGSSQASSSAEAQFNYNFKIYP